MAAIYFLLYNLWLLLFICILLAAIVTWHKFWLLLFVVFPFKVIKVEWAVVVQSKHYLLGKMLISLVCFRKLNGKRKRKQ
jgi:hypothetical protein